MPHDGHGTPAVQAEQPENDTRARARRLYAAARTIEQHAHCEPCREAAREIALIAIDLLVEARMEAARP